MATVKEAMQMRVVLVDRNTSLQTAALIIGQAKLEVLLVADQRKVIGTVSERNIVLGSLSNQWRKATVGDVMLKELLWLFEDDELRIAEPLINASASHVALVKSREQNIVGTLVVDWLR
jgi:CBS domain-containing protein